MTVRKSRMVLVLCLMIFTGLLTGCGCQHEWQKSTCLTPRVCIHCGKTEGKVRSHEWGNTACHEPEGCIFCGTTEGMELTHTWQEDCEICIYCGFDGRPADDRFPELLAAGLEERWQKESDLLNKGQTEEGYVFTKTDWEAMFDAEYTRLAPLKEEHFQNETLGAAALRYIQSLEESKAALEHFGTDRWEDLYHNGAYWEQSIALFEINRICPVSVGEAYQETLTEMINNGEIVNMVRQLLDQIQFLHINTIGGRKKFETTVKNTTSLTFQWFSLDVNLLDENGEILETESIKVTSWKPDQKHRFNFTTLEDFSAVEVAFANWQLPPRR